MNPIHFYRVEDAYGGFSNFSAHPIELDGKRWPTSEHYFQAQKYAGTSREEEIRAAATPGQAAKLGRRKDGGLRPDWEQVKESVMERAVLAKFEQHAELGALLLGTRLAPLVEHTANDSYWGDGGDGSGKNRLGAVLGKVREVLRLRALKETWTQVLRLPTTRFVLFRQGTCVLCADTDPALDLQARALEILAEYRGDCAGTPLGDFRVLRLDKIEGWLVGFDHPDVGRIVLREEFPTGVSNVELGLYARYCRELDAREAGPSIPDACTR